jgi:hypothetical protein
LLVYRKAFAHCDIAMAHMKAPLKKITRISPAKIKERR